MCTSINTNSLSVAQRVIDINTVRDKLQIIISESMCSMVGDSANRVNNYCKNNNLLGRGIFYPQDYYIALKTTNQTKRLNFLKEKGHFFHGFASSKFFNIQSDAKSPTGKLCGFILKNTALPSEALHAISGNELSLLGCGELCQLAQYRAIESILGEEKFNNLFAGNSETPLMLGSSLSKNPIAKLRNYLLWNYSENLDFKLGDVVFFANANSYLSKHLTGDAQGYNAICIDVSKQNEKFVALGTEKTGLSRQGFSEELIKKYNAASSLDHLTESTQQSLYSFLGYNHCLAAVNYKDTQLNYEEFEQQGGGKLTLVCEVDAERVTLLANSSLQEARNLMNSFDVCKRDKRL